MGGTAARGTGRRDSFCGCSIPTVFNQRWIFLKRDQMKQEKESEGRGCEPGTHLVARAATKRKIKLRKVVPNTSEYLTFGFCCERVFEKEKRRRWSLGRKLNVLMCFHDHHRAGVDFA